MIPTDEIISMAREAGIRRFDIIECRNGMPHIYQGSPEAITAFAALVSARAAKGEREACAKVCASKIEYARFRQQEFAKDKMTILVGMMQNTIDDTTDTAAKIRARGDKDEQ